MSIYKYTKYTNAKKRTWLDTAKFSALGQSQQIINQTILVSKDALKGPEAGEYFR